MLQTHDMPAPQLTHARVQHCQQQSQQMGLEFSMAICPGGAGNGTDLDFSPITQTSHFVTLQYSPERTHGVWTPVLPFAVYVIIAVFNARRHSPLPLHIYPLLVVAEKGLHEMQSISATVQKENWQCSQPHELGINYYKSVPIVDVTTLYFK